MAGLIPIALVCVTLFWLGSLSGCAPIYCWYSNTTAPKMTQLDMFEWPQFTDAQHPSFSGRQIEMRPTENDDEWLLLDWDSFNPYASRVIVVSDSGSYIEVGKLPEDIFSQNRIVFTNTTESYKDARVSVEFDEGEYSRYLEPEAWVRAIIGYPLLPLGGKAAGRIIEGDYSGRRLHCYPPRAKISVQTADGSSITTRYELPATENKLHSDDISASVSEDNRFLYIYMENWGALLPINRAP